MTKIRSYADLKRLRSFDERFEYLQLRSQVGASTFGFERHLNQSFYSSREWRRMRDIVIARDNGCDLGVPGHEIHDRVYIHHMNPLVAEDIEQRNDDILDPRFLITTCHNTHNAIHFGDKSKLRRDFTPRRRGDTNLW